MPLLLPTLIHCSCGMICHHCWLLLYIAHVVSGDEILDIHGTSVTGLTIKEVAEVIKNVPYEFLATVRPITALKRRAAPDTSRTVYSTIVPQTPTGSHDNQPAFAINDPATTPSCDELEDCGNYDDEDDGDMPPPLPPRTEDALIIVDHPPPNKRMCVCVLTRHCV